MKNSGRELIDALEKVAVLEWYRYPRHEPALGSPTSVTVVWRFDSKQTTDERVVQINKAMRTALDTATNLEWNLKFTGRNWVLAPARLLELEESGRFRTDNEVYTHIAHEDQDFFAKAHSDLLKMSNALSFDI